MAGDGRTGEPLAEAAETRPGRRPARWATPSEMAIHDGVAALAAAAAAALAQIACLERPDRNRAGCCARAAGVADPNRRGGAGDGVASRRGRWGAIAGSWDLAAIHSSYRVTAGVRCVFCPTACAGEVVAGC